MCGKGRAYSLHGNDVYAHRTAAGRFRGPEADRQAESEIVYRFGQQNHISG